KDSKYARFHAYQGVSLFLTWVIVDLLGRFLPADLSGLGWILSFGVLALAVVGVLNAYHGHARPLPLIGGFLVPKN
ncbi:MAG: hypothetical protein ACHQ4G_10800, partial [Opitutales bacterium]